MRANDVFIVKNKTPHITFYFRRVKNQDRFRKSIRFLSIKK